jgi:hypothetical protein
MVTNREVFYKDPIRATLPNDGVSEVTEPQSEEQWRILEYELSTFVCDGAYRAGLERILSTFLRNLGEAKQPAVWVSGFYGSGKSHLVRVLEFLWRDTKLPNGATARSLTNLTYDVADLLKELGNRGKQEGGLWSAAGRLGSDATDSVRLALLRILFRSAGLPVEYPAARLVLWLEKNGWYNAVAAGVKAAGSTLEEELAEMYVSPILVQSLLAAYPAFAESEAQAHTLIETQFPHVTDITEDQMVAAMKEIFARQSATPGKMPLVLIVLDELQQYLGYNDDKIQAVGLVTEVCSSRFGSKVLFVATGQSALIALPTISRLKDRYTVPIELADADVEKVIREVVLRKAPAMVPEVQAVLTRASNEIDRQLAGTRIGPVAEDKSVWVADYPLLPVRRRFWEKVLRAIDRAGAQGQLRNQLKVAYEAVREIAPRPLGYVVTADSIYQQQAPNMLQTGVLLPEIHDTIARLKDGTPEGLLRSRLMATIFLIGQVNGADSTVGIKSTPDTLADLLVEDLTAGSAMLRQQIPIALQQLTANDNLMLVGNEYHLQTRESAAWNQEYRGHYQQIFSNDAQIAGDRATELQKAVKQALADLAFAQGESKTPRKVELHFASEPPRIDSGTIPIWIRDEWSVAESQVRQDAQAGGIDDPIVYVFLPRRNPEDLKKALAGYAAALATLIRPAPTTPGGIEARRSMETRRDAMRGEIDDRIAAILKEARVFQGGGNELSETDLNASAKAAAQVALARLYPQFNIADNAKWGQVLLRVKQGNNDPLSALGYAGNANDHPTCQRVQNEIGVNGKKGAEVRKKFLDPPYGWPRDAVDGGIMALLVGGHLKAFQNGVQVSVNQVDQNKIGTTEFRSETAIVTGEQRIAAKGLLQSGNVGFTPGNEALALTTLIARMKEMAKEAGGDPPLPLTPETGHLDELLTRTGNDLLIAVFNDVGRLSEEIKAWKAAKLKIETRLKRWGMLQTLLRHAGTLDCYQKVKADADAIKTTRALLTDPDPVPPLISLLAAGLREAVQEAREEHRLAYGAAIDSLYDDPAWRKLAEAQQDAIRARHGLGVLEELNVKTEAALVDTLNATPLPAWKDKTAALSERVNQARIEALQRLKPTAVRVKLPNASLETEADVDQYLSEVRTLILSEIKAGKPVTV